MERKEKMTMTSEKGYPKKTPIQSSPIEESAAPQTPPPLPPEGQMEQFPPNQPAFQQQNLIYQQPPQPITNRPQSVAENLRSELGYELPQIEPPTPTMPIGSQNFNTPPQGYQPPYPQQGYGQQYPPQQQMMQPIQQQAPIQQMPHQPPPQQAPQQVPQQMSAPQQMYQTGSQIVNNVPPPQPVSASLPMCPQCKTHHPPIKPGEKCPMAKEFNEQGDEIDVSQFVANMKNILVSQIKSKGIENINKLTGLLTVEVTKFCEEYKEE